MISRLVGIALVVACASSAGSAVAVAPERTTCVRFGNIKVCRTPGMSYDKVCRTVNFNGISVTKCKKEPH
jgi:opacity protein-like surface antigen